MSSQVVTNFEKHLASLTVGASRETIQTLSKYVAFNRKKHGAALCTALSKAITNTPKSARKMLYLTVAHEVLISESPLQAGYQNDKKWDRLADLRSLLGENVVVDAVKSIRDSDGTNDEVLEKIKTIIDMWEEIGAFGGPTIVAAARKALTADKQADKPSQADSAASASDSKSPATAKTDVSPAAKEASAEPSSAEIASPPPSEADGKVADEPQPAAETKEASPSKAKAQIEIEESAAAKSHDGGDDDDDKASAKDGESGTAAPATDAPPAFDFEAEDIPYGKVAPHQLLGSCRSLATMQISRDLRNDSAVRISTALSTLSPDVEEACRKALADAKGDASKATVDLASIPTISDDVLDLNVDDAIKNVQQYKEIIVKQREARKALIDMLIKSRCKFGSMEAAETFYSIAAKDEKLKKRRLLLQDAMELEGLDVIEDEEVKEEDNIEANLTGTDEGKLAPLTWYEKEKAAAAAAAKEIAEPEAKKARVQ